MQKNTITILDAGMGKTLSLRGVEIPQRYGLPMRSSQHQKWFWKYIAKIYPLGLG